MKEAVFVKYEMRKDGTQHSGVERIAKSLGMIPILEDDLYAVSACGGIITGCLGLSPMDVEDPITGEKRVVYAFELPMSQLKDPSFADRTADVEGRLHGPYHVTATDVPMSYQIVRKGLPPWALRYIDVPKDKIPKSLF